LTLTSKPWPASGSWRLAYSLRGWLVALVSLLAIAGPSEATSAQDLQGRLDGLAERYAKLETQLANTESRSARLRVDLEAARRTLRARSEALSARAVYLYKQGGQAAMFGELLLAPDAASFRSRLALLSAVSSRDALVIDEVVIASAREEDLRQELDRTRLRQTEVLASLDRQQQALQAELDSAKQREQALARAAGNTGRSRSQRVRQEIGGPARAQGAPGLALPVLGPVGFADTWGAPRSGGRRHMGTDIMAPCGAKVVAVADGVVSDTQQGGSGGTMLWIRGRSGDTYFYAHLQSYANGVATGRSVSAGEVIAFNGNSGNARGGPCHVHFQWHPGGGGAVNPYRLLRSMG
jgi:peptidoglycan LD-endopeptidase LytH